MKILVLYQGVSLVPSYIADIMHDLGPTQIAALFVTIVCCIIMLLQHLNQQSLSNLSVDLMVILLKLKMQVRVSI